MSDADDRQLLREYLTERDERAFTELVKRHVDLVYSAASRQIADPGLAQDVTQAVFVLLAQKARTIRDGEALAGWLLVTTRWTAINALRAQARRRRHENQAAAMNQEMRSHEDRPLWESVRPLLDDAISRLKREDRDAITLRYFKGQSLGEVAAVLGVSEQAAQKRVGRAVERLRAVFARYGVSSTSEALMTALTANVVTQAPAQLSSQIAGVAFSAAGTAGPVVGGVTKGAAILMATTKTKVALTLAAVVLLAGVATPVVYLMTEDPATRPHPPAPAPSPEPARVVAAVANDDSRARLNAVYCLAPGQNLKRVLPPFIQERNQLLASANGRGMPPQLSAMVFRGDEQHADFRLGRTDTMDLGDVLRATLEIWPQDTDIDRGLLATKLEGDWVIRDDSKPGDRIAELMRSISELVGAGMVLKQEPMEREVIVVGGKLNYTEALRPKEIAHTVHIFRGATRPKQSWNLSMGQTADEMLQLIGEVIGRPMVIEADLGENKPAAIATYQYADFRRALQVPDGKTVDEILANLSKQTSLQFTRERRVVPTWRLVKQDL